MLFIIFTVVLNIYTIIDTNFKSLFDQGNNLDFFCSGTVKILFLINSEYSQIKTTSKINAGIAVKEPGKQHIFINSNEFQFCED